MNILNSSKLVIQMWHICCLLKYIEVHAGAKTSHITWCLVSQVTLFAFCLLLLICNNLASLYVTGLKIDFSMVSLKTVYSQVASIIQFIQVYLDTIDLKPKTQDSCVLFMAVI